MTIIVHIFEIQGVKFVMFLIFLYCMKCDILPISGASLSVCPIFVSVEQIVSFRGTLTDFDFIILQKERESYSYLYYA